MQIELSFGRQGLIVELPEKAIPQIIRKPKYPVPEEPHAFCLLYTSPSPRDLSTSRMPSSA